jgi:hypothetical protein
VDKAAAAAPDKEQAAADKEQAAAAVAVDAHPLLDTGLVAWLVVAASFIAHVHCLGTMYTFTLFVLVRSPPPSVHCVFCVRGR